MAQNMLPKKMSYKLRNKQKQTNKSIINKSIKQEQFETLTEVYFNGWKK